MSKKFVAPSRRKIWITVEIEMDNRIKDPLSDEYEEYILNEIYNNNWTLIGSDELEGL